MRVSSKQLLPKIATLDELMAQHHIYAAGPTGSGKSILVEHLWNCTSHTAICFNVEKEPLRGRHAATERDIPRLLQEGHQRIVLRAPEKDSELMIEAAGRFRDIMFRIGERYKANQRAAEHWVNMFFPEAQKYSNKGDKEGPLPDVLQRGRKRGIHAVTDSQSPSATSQVVLTQSKVRFLFDFDDFELDYFRGYKVPIDEFRAHLQQEHHFVLTKGNGWVPYKPVPFEE